MAFRIHLLFVYTVLCLLSLHNTNSFKAVQLPKSEPRIVGFSWQNCGAPADPFMIRSVTLSPDPFKIPGNVTIGISVSFVTPSPTDIALMVIVQKKVAPFIWVKVPCVNNVGSCTYGDVCKDWAGVCVKYFQPFGFPCNCPIPANTYTIPDLDIEVTKALPAQAYGEFRIIANLLSGSEGELGCLEIDITTAQ